jgi:hypothetical protein
MHVSKIHVPIRGSVSRFFLYSALAFALVLAFSVVASAQTTDVFRVTYFDNNGVAGAPNAYVHILNPGLAGAPAPAGTLCASIYIWRFDQELSECCSCPITANGLLTFTVLAATSNPGDGGPIPTTGSIAIIADSACNAANPTPTPDLRAWATHVNLDPINTAAGGYDVTETEALDTPLSTGELAEAASRCAFLRVNSTGHGICDGVTPFHNICTGT